MFFTRKTSSSKVGEEFAMGLGSGFGSVSRQGFGVEVNLGASVGAVQLCSDARYGFGVEANLGTSKPPTGLLFGAASKDSSLLL